MPNIVKVPITKAKQSLEIDVDKIPDNVYKALVLEGLKSFANRGMTKVTTAKLEGDELAKAQAAALEIGQKNIEAILAGKVRIVGAKDGKVSGAVNTEAMRLARNLVKDEMKKQNIKVSHVDAKEITAAAKQLIQAHPELIDQAKKNLEERSKVASGLAINVSGIPINAAKAKKAEEENAKKRKPKAEGQLSAAQAKTTAKKSKPAQATA